MMKLSIELLRFDHYELQEFLSDKALENPLLEIYEPSEGRFSCSPREANENNFSIENIAQTKTSFFDFILEQIYVNYHDTYLRELVLFYVNYLDENGFLSISLAEAKKISGAREESLVKALSILRKLEPVGVGARNVQECFMMQCEDNPYAPALTFCILEECYELLIQRKWKNIAKRFNCSLQEVQEVFDFVGKLNSSPAKSFKVENDLSFNLVPDLSVAVNEGTIQLQENKKYQSKISINKDYLETIHSMYKMKNNQLDRYLSEKEKEVQYLQNIIKKRASTIFQVGEFIVSFQKEFFLDDSHPVQPLKMSTVAEALSVHESTISRTVNGKYLETDWGIFELRHFFSNALENGERDEAALSSQQVKERIKELLTHENPESPYSDSTLEKMLAEENICVSRRTVAKYRESLGVLSSAKRRRFV
ncbi:RNA polymerase factor sigma-54 [Lactovum odontotermitis]